MLNKEKQYTEIYFPESMIEDKEQAYFALLDIESNFSKLVQDLLPNIKNVAKFIQGQENNRLHYEWGIVIRHKPAKAIRRFIGGKQEVKRG